MVVARLSCESYTTVTSIYHYSQSCDGHEKQAAITMAWSLSLWRQAEGICGASETDHVSSSTFSCLMLGWVFGICGVSETISLSPPFLVSCLGLWLPHPYDPAQIPSANNKAEEFRMSCKLLSPKPRCFCWYWVTRGFAPKPGRSPDVLASQPYIQSYLKYSKSFLCSDFMSFLSQLLFVVSMEMKAFGWDHP